MVPKLTVRRREQRRKREIAAPTRGLGYPPDHVDSV